MKLRKLDRQGYTAAELLVVLLIFSVLGFLFAYTLRQNAKDARDVERKRDISAIYFGLEANKSAQGYPEKISQDSLKGIDPESLVDPKGVSLGQPGAEYRYYPADCTNGYCKTYELKVSLEKEAEYVKKSAN